MSYIIMMGNTFAIWSEVPAEVRVLSSHRNWVSNFLDENTSEMVTQVIEKGLPGLR